MRLEKAVIRLEKAVIRLEKAVIRLEKVVQARNESKNTTPIRTSCRCWAESGHNEGV